MLCCVLVLLSSINSCFQMYLPPLNGPHLLERNLIYVSHFIVLISQCSSCFLILISKCCNRSVLFLHPFDQSHVLLLQITTMFYSVQCSWSLLFQISAVELCHACCVKHTIGAYTSVSCMFSFAKCEMIDLLQVVIGFICGVFASLLLFLFFFFLFSLFFFFFFKQYASFYSASLFFCLLMSMLICVTGLVDDLCL